jgi:hypothetical protein
VRECESARVRECESARGWDRDRTSVSVSPAAVSYQLAPSRPLAL